MAHTAAEERNAEARAAQADQVAQVGFTALTQLPSTASAALPQHHMLHQLLPDGTLLLLWTACHAGATSAVHQHTDC